VYLAANQREFVLRMRVQAILQHGLLLVLMTNKKPIASSVAMSGHVDDKHERSGVSRES